MWSSLLFSGLGLFVLGRIPGVLDVPVLRSIVENAAIEWIVAFMVLLPLRLLLNRREAQDIVQEWKAGNITAESLTPLQLGILHTQEYKWPRGLRWLGSRGLEKWLTIVILVITAMIVVPLFLIAVVWALSMFFR